MKEYRLSLERCKRSIILLSLDITMLVYEHMGLILPKVKKNVFMEELRKIIMDMGGASVSIPILQTLTQDVLVRIEGCIGQQERDHYQDWVIYIYEESPSDHPHTHAWSSILTWCAASPQRWVLLDLPKSISRKELEIAINCQDVEDILARSMAAPLSQWDSKTLDERKFEDAPWDPTSAVENNVFRYRFRCALKALVDQLSEEEVVSFWKSVQEVGLENELTVIEDLKGPKDLQEPA